MVIGCLFNSSRCYYLDQKAPQNDKFYAKARNTTSMTPEKSEAYKNNNLYPLLVEMLNDINRTLPPCQSPIIVLPEFPTEY
jgi:hypothetical protein